MTVKLLLVVWVTVVLWTVAINIFQGFGSAHYFCSEDHCLLCHFAQLLQEQLCWCITAALLALNNTLSSLHDHDYYVGLKLC